MKIPENHQEQHYALSAGKLIHIDNAHKGEEYRCPYCNGIMIAKQGSIREWHFAHKHNACDYDNYLHTLAEIRICEWYNNASEINLILPTKQKCERYNICPMFTQEYCVRNATTDKINLKQYFPTCVMEHSFSKAENTFRADLFCAHHTLKEEPLFIEICVNHPCEKDKINSGIRIIELVIQNESDIDNVINNTLKENGKVKFYGFKPKNKVCSPENLNPPLERFTLYLSMKGFCKNIKCDDIEKHKGIFELTCAKDKCVPFSNFQNLFQNGLAVASSHFNQLKVCYLCQYQAFNDYEDKYICKLYRAKNLSKYCKDNDATKCQHFSLNLQNQEQCIAAIEEHGQRFPLHIWKENKQK